LKTVIKEKLKSVKEAFETVAQSCQEQQASQQATAQLEEPPLEVSESVVR